jgi:hypothetical protein
MLASLLLSLLFLVVLNSVAGAHRFHVDLDPDQDPDCNFDPDPACYFDAVPDPDPTFHFGAVPDPDPSFQIKAQNLEKGLN